MSYVNEPTVLDWRGKEHLGRRPEKCVHCPGKTPLRDDAGRPSHKVCAEEALKR